MTGTAKSWGYCTQPITTSELALPAEEVRKQTRFFNGEEARKIITVAPEPYRTMFAIAAMTGLRAGEVVGLQKADLDFDRRVIHVRRSAWYGRVQTVKSKASRAPVAMSEALSALLKDYLATWKPNPAGFLFLNRNGRPYAANKVVEYGLWPVLDKLGIERAGMHAFRHCHASLLMDVGANPTVAKAQMRHVRCANHSGNLRPRYRRFSAECSGQSGRAIAARILRPHPLAATSSYLGHPRHSGVLNAVCRDDAGRGRALRCRLCMLCTASRRVNSVEERSRFREDLRHLRIGVVLPRRSIAPHGQAQIAPIHL
jgi:hypothetical protein